MDWQSGRLPWYVAPPEMEEAPLKEETEKKDKDETPVMEIVCIS